jgi:hypothetical protein
MFIIGMRRKSDGAFFMCDTKQEIHGISDYNIALAMTEDKASRLSEAYDYLVLEVVAVARVVNKPVETLEGDRVYAYFSK